jgi:cell division protein FtsL
MFLQTTPDTSGYMIAGYAVAFIVMALYVFSMAMRSRNLKQDLTTLEEMDKASEQQKVKTERDNSKPVTKKNGEK